MPSHAAALERLTPWEQWARAQASRSVPARPPAPRLSRRASATSSFPSAAAPSSRAPLRSKRPDHGFLPADSAPTEPPFTAAAQREAEEVLGLAALLPPAVRSVLESHPELPQLVEVVMDLGRVPLARFPSGDIRLAEQVVAPEDLAYAVSLLGDFGGDNRAGIDRTLHRISCIRNRAGRVVGLTCRVGRSVMGSAAMVADLAREGKSILLLGGCLLAFLLSWHLWVCFSFKAG
jgi:hypothetical protein